MQWRRLITQQELCRDILGIDATTFRNLRNRLERDGFPLPHPVLGRYDPALVFDYLDRDRETRAPSAANDTDGHDPDAALATIANRMRAAKGAN